VALRAGVGVDGARRSARSGWVCESAAGFAEVAA